MTSGDKSTIKDIDSFLEEYKLLEKTYSRAQEKLLIEKVTDNELIVITGAY